MRNDKVTIITPTYNRAELLSRLWDSINSQTYRNFEWIIVDDASSDNTKNIVKKFNDFRIVYILLTHNQGQNAARNAAAKHISGSYIIYLDSDDTFYSNYSLQLMVDSIKNTSNNIGTVAFSVVTTSGIKKSFINGESVLDTYPDSICRKNAKGEFLSIQKKDAALSEKFPSDYPGMESLRHYKINEKFDTLFIDTPVRVYYDNNADNETNALNLLQKLEVLIAGTEEMIKRYKEIWLSHCKKQYGVFLFKLAFYQVLNGEEYKAITNIIKSCKNKGPFMNNMACFFLLLLPPSMRRFIFIKFKKYLKLVY